MTVVGVDGCKSGWFAVRLEPGERYSFKVFRWIEELWNEWGNVSLILIDIPIGLSDTKRRCDTDARVALGRRHSTVFTPPCRAALEAPCYTEASDENHRVTSRKLSKQAYGILPKISEVDELVRHDTEARSRIREVHPEVCFWAFADGTPMTARKSRRDGFQERLNLLCQLDARTESIVDRALGEFRGRGVARDDILDALVAALTADCDPHELRSFPSKPQFDKYGLPMEMVYCHEAEGRAAPGRNTGGAPLALKKMLPTLSDSPSGPSTLTDGPELPST